MRLCTTPRSSRGINRSRGVTQNTQKKADHAEALTAEAQRRKEIGNFQPHRRCRVFFCISLFFFVPSRLCASAAMHSHRRCPASSFYLYSFILRVFAPPRLRCATSGQATDFASLRGAGRGEKLLACGWCCLPVVGVVTNHRCAFMVNTLITTETPRLRCASSGQAADYAALHRGRPLIPLHYMCSSLYSAPRVPASSFCICIHFSSAPLRLRGEKMHLPVVGVVTNHRCAYMVNTLITTETRR